ncbi:uracil-DNA glycosylase [Robertkochia aurantiaca]|uniref:uracil-DNA glycosylase n=1 Tax=Robertkochia aurantiaca TaxID=2873700 RepID=UPI001CCB0182|nr:uracil-DNA glycosylase [Robertkochia sp. 3YJGBD-33]
MSAKERLQNLEWYLIQMYPLNPDTLLIGEAPGYKGAALTGIPFTSPEILKTHRFFIPLALQRKKPVLPTGERTASVVWNELNRYEKLPLLWNIFPFHPYRKGNKSSNRSPMKSELRKGLTVCKELLKIFEIKTVITIGKKSSEALQEAGIYHLAIRHPSYGGIREFRSGLSDSGFSPFRA